MTTMQKTNTQPEIWGGIECTINRLAGGYSDQLALSGHYDREDDIDAIAALGIAALRYPVLWEKHQPLEHGDTDFTWVASRLEQIKSHNIKPIAGLVHHGSGPEYTNLLDPHFPELLAAYARKVAERFPWINMYTPVNEPLTTARFSGMYGFWFPHEKSELAYIKMLLNQLKATVLAMKEIRKINPEALLVQTEDLGKTYSTPLLSYQAKFENDRRFYTQDILCGRFTKEHPSWNYFVSLGIAEADLEFFIENPCPPGLLGVNYYCTSERFLDENIHNYPLSTHGGNGIHAYADVEAVRVRMSEPHGFSALVNELYERYNIPVAITEAHLNCSREGQMKWFLDIYESACSLKQQGVDIRAVTSWSLLGAYGWNKLLTTTDKTYERGVFDVSSGKRRPTAMAKMIRELALTGKHSSHALHAPGWWNRDSRFFEQHTVRPSTDLLKDARPIVILGKTGTLGKALARICGSRLLHHVLLGREDADITDADAIKKIITLYKCRRLCTC
jgi:dTDP-4-dehydrorhamnose reductase